MENVSPHLAEYVGAIHKALFHGNEFMRRVYRAHLFMRRPEARHIAEHGRALMREYISCAEKAFDLQFCRFKYAPKLHIFGYMVLNLEKSIQAQTWIMTPIAYSCQLDEDTVGRISTLSKSCCLKTVHESTIRKYLVSVRLNTILKGIECRRVARAGGTGRAV